MKDGVLGYAHATVEYTKAFLNDPISEAAIGRQVRELLLAGKAVFVKELSENKAAANGDSVHKT